MKVSAVQFEPLILEKEKNLSKIAEYSKNLDSDLIVFPELCTSGYYLSKEELSRMAESFQGNSVNSIQEISSKENKIIVFGFPELDDGKYYNSAAVLFPDKSYSKVYRKTHLFFREKYIFTPGDTGFFNINYPEFDLNLGTMICYDWRFPEAARTLGLAGSDLIVMPSNLVTKIWHRSMPARALDNRIYLLVANRTGTENRNEENLEFTGKSGIWDYNGGEIAIASPTDECVITTEINPKETRNKDINEINNIFNDRIIQFYNLT
jgi:predicted amidohydrolase